MVATEQKRVARPTADRLHSAAVGFHARGLWVVMAAAVQGAPEVGIHLEISAAPILTHGAEHIFEMFLRTRVRAVDRVPRAVPPSAEADRVRWQRLAGIVFQKPLGVLAEHLRVLFGDERRNPNSRLEPAPSNLFDDAENVAAERLAGDQPFADGRLVAVSHLHELQRRNLTG